MSELVKKVLVIDWETTGLRDHKDDTPRFDKGPQGIQIGAVVCNPDNNWEIEGEFISNVRWMGDYYKDLFWSDQAYNVHKISKEMLLEAPTPPQAGAAFVEFIGNHFDLSKGIQVGGHGVEFDIYFSRQLFSFAGILDKTPVRFGHQELDTRTLGYFLWGTSHSDILFSKILGKKQRKEHNALEDAKLTAEVFAAAQKKLISIR